MCRTANLFIIQTITIISVCAGLCASGAHTASRYEHLLAQPGQRAKLAALARLEESRAWSPQTLEPLATDPNPLIRLRCAEVIGRVGDRRGIPLLARLADDEDAGVAETAVFSLGLVGGGEATAPLGRCLTGKPRNIRLRAIEALGRTGDPKAAQLLVPLVTNFHAAIRAKALLALAAVDDSTAAIQCAQALYDPDLRVISTATYALGRLERDEAAGEIVQFMAHENDEVRMRAVEALGRMKAETAVPFIAALLKDENRMIVIKTAEALARIGKDKSANALLPLFESKDGYLRTLALDGIAASGKKKFFEKCLPLLEDGSPMVRRAAMKAIASTDPERARAHLLTIIRNATGTEAMNALEWLGHVSDAKDLPLFVEKLAPDNEHLVREGAAAGLGRWRKPDELNELMEGVQKDARHHRPLEALIEAADGDDWVVATIAIESLAKVAPGATLGLLMNIYQSHDERVDSDRRLAIIESITDFMKRHGMAQEEKSTIVSFLNKACTDADPRIGTAAARIAKEFGATLEPQPTGTWKRGEPPWTEPFLPLGEKRIVLSTGRGEIEIRLFGDDAPTIVGAILHLAREGFYDGLTFHRVVPGFVIQGGCPRGDGWGDAGYYLRSQFNLHPYERGTVGMAHSGKDTPGSQIFITHMPQPHLDARYTVIGTVVRGMEVVDSIETGDTFSVKVVE